MEILQKILIGFVALEHLYFLVLEMFLWTKPYGRRAFGLQKDFAESTKVLAANQGLYNGFLAAGLIWSLLETNIAFAQALQYFFLACVIIAGIYGAYSTKKARLFYVQSVPAIIALAVILMN
ncbi:DUF1304 family protein [Leptobacterium flavescens]|uniref:DUF1304 family protein n=1 Tax=Leptobacterium flavescens TaxID=472055 RepID=A0A6P0UNT2_9FLAO|nr:DUF1304 domain-containing protein [Leptobacterium flavescens]NER12643.1 DUF1304 family protein [Leptobacterium flavescens]